MIFMFQLKAMELVIPIALGILFVIEISKPKGTVYIVNEGHNIVCAKALSSIDESDVVCSQPYKLDKTAPNIELQITGTLGENDWYTSDVDISLIEDANDI